MLDVRVALDNPSGVERELLAEFRKQAAAFLERLTPGLRSDVRALDDRGLRESPEWESLLGGKLRENFGLPNAADMLEDVAAAVRESVRVEVVPGADESLGGLSVAALRDDFGEVLSARGASFTYEAKPKPWAGKSGGPVSIPWLQWLLFEGDNVILADVEINLARASRGASRTGRAVMVHVGSSKFSTRRSRGWSVPPEFSGVKESNWLSRVVRGAEPQLKNLLERAVSGGS